MSRFGAKLKSQREKKGLSQIDLAEMVGVSSFQVISKWENGRAMPDTSTVLKLCEILECTPNFLLLDDENAKDDYSESEVELINNYRLLDNRGRASIDGLIKAQFNWLATNDEISKLSLSAAGEGNIDKWFLSKKDDEYQKVKNSIPKLKQLKSETKIEYGIIRYKLMEQDCFLRVIDLIGIFAGSKIPTKKLYDMILKIINDDRIMMNKFKS